MSRPVPRLSIDGLLLRPWTDMGTPAVLELASDAAPRWMRTLRTARSQDDAHALD